MPLLPVQQASDPTQSKRDYEIHLAIVGQAQGTIKGESTSKAHPQEIEVYAFDWSVASAPITAARGKPTLSSVTITKGIDRASTNLITATLNSEVIKTATISWSKSTGSNTTDDFFTITLTNAFVASVHITSGGPSVAKGMGAEVISLSFQKIEINYKQQTGMGLVQAAGSVTCNIADMTSS